MTVAVRFTVHGTPAPAGSKRGFYNAKAGRVLITDASARSRPWKAQVADAAAQAMNGRPLLDGPLRLALTFYVTRPKGHYGKRGLRPTAPVAPTVKPDLLKLARAVEDALTGVAYRDDAQIVYESLWKHYGESARVEVDLYPLPIADDVIHLPNYKAPPRLAALPSVALDQPPEHAPPLPRLLSRPAAPTTDQLAIDEELETFGDWVRGLETEGGQAR